MRSVLLVGGGKVGRTIARFLARTGDYDVTVADADARAFRNFSACDGCRTSVVDATDKDALCEAATGKDVVVSALSYAYNVRVATAALEAGASYFDLTEDVATTRAVRLLADRAAPGQVFVPQCGLAPGFVGIAGHALAKKLDRVDALALRVGALPEHPTNALKYNLTWSTDGLINEYLNPCEVIERGERKLAPPLEGLEELSLDGVRYEAFHTSGGLGTLCETLEGAVRELSYKTIRYPGHRDLMRFLLHEMRLAERRELLREMLENAIPTTTQDVVIVVCEARGYKDGSSVQVTDARKIYGQNVDGEELGAIQLTTAAGICAMVDLHVEGRLAKEGFARQEDTSLEVFLANRFGRVFGRRAASAELGGTPRRALDARG